MWGVINLEIPKIKRLAKGKFYRPKQGLLGELKLSDNEMLKTVLYKNNRLSGYLTGSSLYNRLGLTTQVPKTIIIAVTGARQKKDFGTIRVELITARAPITKQNIPLLELLDALKDIKKIARARASKSLRLLSLWIKKLSPEQQKQLVKLALQYYTASTCALLGLVFDTLDLSDTTKLKVSLNPTTIYEIGLNESEWPKKKSWNIR